MIQQKYVKSRDKTKVTFEIPLMHLPEGYENVDTIAVVADFNNWEPTANQLDYVKKNKAYKTTVELDPNRTYQFRYLLNGDTYFNEWEADGYTANEYGEENCVLHTKNGG